MNIPYDHECFLWVWKVDKHDDSEFIFKYVNGQFGYSYVNSPEQFYFWNVKQKEIEGRLSVWYKERPTDFHGPMQPPPSPVVLKIRQMYARREYV